MSPTTLPLLVAALAAVAPAAANLEPTGPYTITLDYLGKCDDGEYPDQINNITQIWKEKSQHKAFKGCINRTYDDLCDECQMEVSVHKWGSTGGWSKFYELSFSKPYDYVTENFPVVYEALWEPLGFTKKPVTAGVYCLHRNMELPFTLGKFVMLPYGNYKLYTKGSKGGERQTCLQMNVIISEVGQDYELED